MGRALGQAVPEHGGGGGGDGWWGIPDHNPRMYPPPPLAETPLL